MMNGMTEADVTAWKAMTLEELVDDMGGSFNRALATEMIRVWSLSQAAKAEKDAAIYKDAFKDATMANTVAAKNLAEQEAKTVEYRAAWIKAQRERDEYRARLRERVGAYRVHDHAPGRTCREHLVGECRLYGLDDAVTE